MHNVMKIHIHGLSGEEIRSLLIDEEVKYLGKVEKDSVELFFDEARTDLMIECVAVKTRSVLDTKFFLKGRTELYVYLEKESAKKERMKRFSLYPSHD